MKYGDVMQLTSDYMSKFPADSFLRVMCVQPKAGNDELFVGMVIRSSDEDECGDLNGGWLADAFEVVP